MLDPAIGTTSILDASKTPLFLWRSDSVNRNNHRLLLRARGGGRRRNASLSKNSSSGRASSSVTISESKTLSSSSSPSSQSRWERELLWRPAVMASSGGSSSRRRNYLREKLLLLPRRNKNQEPRENVVSIDPSLTATGETDAVEEDESGQVGLAGESVAFRDSSSLVECIQPVPIIRGMPLRALPYGRAMALCTFCILAAAAKLFALNGKAAELRREEVDMLTRKRKSRMDKKKLVKGSVTVLQSEPGLPVSSDTRPQLDMNQLTKCIEIAEKSGSDCSSQKLDFGGKLGDAREMAIEVQELELQDCAHNDEGLPGREPSSLLHASKDHTVAKNSDDHETDTFEFLKQLPSPVENGAQDSSSNTSINLHALGNEGIEQNGTGTAKLVEKESRYTASGTSSSVRQMQIPKILKSVQKAKEYLLEKNGISADKPPSGPDVQLKCLAADVDDTCNVTVSELHNENINNTYPCEFNMAKNYGDVASVFLEKNSFAKNESETSHELGISTSLLSVGINDNKVAVQNNMDVPGILDNDSRVSTDKMAYVDESLLGTINTEDTCSETVEINSFTVEERSIGDQSGRDNDAHFFHTSNDRQGMESRGTLYTGPSSVAHSSARIRGMMDDAPDNSKELNSFLDGGNVNSEAQVKAFQDAFGVCKVMSNKHKASKGKLVMENKNVGSADLNSDVRSFKESNLDKVEFNGNVSQLYPIKDNKSLGLGPLTLDAAQGSGEKPDIKGLPCATTRIPLGSTGEGHESKGLKIDRRGSWFEDNFKQFDPIIKMVGTGFRENYMLAKEKVQQSVVNTNLSELGLLDEDEELEWMKDEKLKKIVSQVRDNELAGRDPFHMMAAVDQRAFFEGLELKAEKMNGKLSDLHEWIHSRIENLCYGSDGISLDDPPEKIIPFWKGPTIDKELECLHKFTEHDKMVNFSGNAGQPHAVNEQTQHTVRESEKLPFLKNISIYSHANKGSANGASTNKNTLIESSDGSRRVGKKMGMEHWEHTKKCSQGFLEVYNAESDPEIKSIIKDMGKYLDRWMTEKEIQEAADLMTRIPKKKRRYIQKKMDKLKREVEIYGAQAVISKYREYSDEKEEDHLWWLDLHFVLCIELYTMEDGVQKIGLYALEMAADLELHPVQHHVIAFEDPGDSKNLCYIIQAHMDMLGGGRAFVVARPPKDAFREAKANGFNVTVIKKGELKLNVDQTLEEVEEEITEVGSKIYHDKIMKDRGVDIRTLMNGVVRAGKAARSKPKGMPMMSGKS